MSIDADRLRKVAALLTSPVDGEALAALRRVEHILAADGISVADALCRGVGRMTDTGPEGTRVPEAAEGPMPKKGMVCRFTVTSTQDLGAGLRVIHVTPISGEGAETIEHRTCVASGRVAAQIEARLFQDPNAEFLAKFNIPFRTHREDPKVASVQPLA